MVPTKYRRIAVTNDEELAEALARVRPILNGLSDARLVHELAIRGAEATLAQEEERKAALQWLIEWSTDPNSSMDREALRNVKRDAWHH